MANPIIIRMGGYGPPTTGFSRAMKLIGDKLVAQFGDRIDVKYAWNIMDLGYKAEEIVWLVESGLLEIPKFVRTIEYVRVYGTTVIVAGSEDVVWGGKMPMAGKPSHLRFTAVWMQQGGRWQQVARHANIVQP